MDDNNYPIGEGDFRKLNGHAFTKIIDWGFKQKPFINFNTGDKTPTNNELIKFLDDEASVKYKVQIGGEVLRQDLIDTINKAIS